MKGMEAGAQQALELDPMLFTNAGNTHEFPLFAGRARQVSSVDALNG
jgi:hypothetical protein